MNVALAGVKLPPKRQLSANKDKRKIAVTSPATSTPSPSSPFTPFGKSPERNVTDKRVGFDFSKKELEQISPGSGRVGSPPPADLHIVDDVDDANAPVRVKTETWIRPTLQADTEIQLDGIDEEAPMAISPMAIKAAEVRRSSINWSVYLQSQIITQDHYDCIFILESYGKQKRDHLLNHHGAQCARLLLEMTWSISKPSPVQYILTMIDDFLQEDRNRGNAFHQYASAKDGSKGWALFFPFLNRDDPFIVQQAARIIAKLACWSSELMQGAELQIYLVFLKDQIRSGANDFRQSTARCLQMIVRVAEYRVAFTNLDGISSILTALKQVNNFQIQYQLIFCLWCLTFDPDIAAKFQNYNAIQVLASVLAESQKDKVTRIIIATLRNLLENPIEDALAQEHALTMIHSRILNTLKFLSTKKFEDNDILEDIQYLTDELESIAVNISTYDQYVSELKSGALEWSPVHKNEPFWRENVTLFNDSNYELVKILVRLLEVSTDPMVLAVAVHDIGQYMRYYPPGKKVVERLGGKDRAMSMLTHPDANVRYQALLAVQKMMVQNWEFLGRRIEREQEGGPDD
ncbi:V-type proton ATPase subunit H [Hypsibius exemplaris]|uniref:V-type proton ATPase subunit H n=1 Tax=Hypsibius exemplaris TaxID=2072580 RepID=A0A1W0WSK0_HYPEX|nr:V-type proton ATPase subunit H [Hypsibius exemplaris]